MHQTTHFFNLGYGWLCKHCSAENTERKQQHHQHHQHEAQRNAPLPLAKSVEDGGLRGLQCPQCGIAEPVSRI
jgi:DNA-directed RNA polymerase subunit RPC12/RpoP